ncbi:MAG: thioredoxin fold domain-containing protein [Myxococcales bacterium]|nr:thioredoxin fold domain-containing protein [Myxococcales bacterium]
MDDKLYLRCAKCGSINRIPAARLREGPRCGRCSGQLSAHPADVDDAGLQKLIESSPVPVLVDFWAPWCGPCRQLAPHVEALALRHAGALIVAKIDTDQHQGFAQALGVRGIPLLCVYKGGELVRRQPGAVFGAELENVVAPYL